ncbi:MAG: hypothetical protein ABSA16_09950 [Thermoguttaceae bacterium]|jgi:hypothetical protein
MTSKTEFIIPPLEQVRKRLAATTAESRFLRRLYRLAKEKDTAERLRSEVESQKKGGFSHDSSDK